MKTSLLLVNAFYATGLFRHSLKTSENQRFPGIFRGYRKGLVAWNGLKSTSRIIALGQEQIWGSWKVWWLFIICFFVFFVFFFSLDLCIMLLEQILIFTFKLMVKMLDGKHLWFYFNIFFLHNHCTYSSSKLTVQYLELPTVNIILWNFRNLDSTYKIVGCNDLTWRMSLILCFNYIRYVFITICKSIRYCGNSLTF